MIVDSDSSELPDLASGLDHDGKDEGSMEESEGGIGEDSDDEFDQAKLTEKDAKRVLHDEVKFLSNLFFLLICPLATQRCFDSLR